VRRCFSQASAGAGNPKSCSIRSLCCGFDLPVGRASGQHGGVEKIVAVRGEEKAATRAADTVARAADPLDRRRDRGRRLDQDDLVQFADVDPQLQRVRGDDGPELPVFEALLHGEADLPGKGAVVGVSEDFGLALVDQAGHLLGGPAAVDEKEGRAILPDDLPEGLGEDGPPGGIDEAFPGVRRKSNADLGALFLERRYDLDGAFLVAVLSPIAPLDEPADKSGRGGKGPDRRRECDPLEFTGEKDEALDGRDQVGPPLRSDDRVDLVEDDRCDPRQHRPAAPGTQEEI
jgi:hypothetical protein